MLSEKLINDIIKYRTHPVEWIEDRISVIHPAKGIVPFNLYDFQKKCLSLIFAKHLIVVLKSRQVGFSTIMQAASLWMALHYANYRILILSAGLRASVKFLGDIKGMYERMPDEYKMKIQEEPAPGKKRTKTTNNKTEISFENGSSIIALPASSSAARGTSVNFLIIDEAAFIPQIENAYAGIFPTLSRAFKSDPNRPYGIAIVSTPNGVGNFYHEQYVGAVEGRNNFTPLRVHWSEVPEYDMDWYIDQCSAMGWSYRAIQSELELSFCTSGNTYIPSQILGSIVVKEPIEKTLDDAFWVFKMPEEGHKYVIGVDFAYGTNHDASTVVVIDAQNLEEVAEYCSNKIIASKFAEVIVSIIEMYKASVVNIERNAGGKILIELIIHGHPEIEKRLFRDSKTGDIIHEEGKFGQLLSKKTDIGTMVTGVSRDIILANMYNIILEKYIDLTSDLRTEEAEDDPNEDPRLKLVRQNLHGADKASQIKVEGIISSERLLMQMLSFVVDKNGRPSGKDNGGHDDLVFSYAHALYAYSKTKHYLLKDIANMIPQKVEIKPKLAFEEKYSTQLLRTVNYGRTEKEINDFIKALDEEDEAARKVKPDDSRASAIWEAFLS